MKYKKILVSGAGIAGQTLAYWLSYYGFEVTVIERAGSLRLGGQNIDVKGPALQVAKKMGIEHLISASNTNEIGLRWVDIRNRTVAEFPKNEAVSMTQEHEILRGDLVKILYESTKNKAEYLFGIDIVSLQENENDVTLIFSNGESKEYNLVISAEGIGSKTRDTMLGDAVAFDYKGLYTTYFTIDKTPDDSRWARWCNSIRGVVFLLRPDNYGTTRACINFLSPENGYEKLEIDDQKKLLKSKVVNFGYEAKRLTEAIDKADDIYLDRLSQVKASRWSKGRFAVVGDAAHCATPLAGKGTDMAMAGPYILAGELATADDHNEAFTLYEQKMRPYAEACQKLPPGVPRLVYPTSHTGLKILNSTISVIGSKFVKSVMAFFGKKDKDDKSEFILPDYNRL